MGARDCDSYHGRIGRYGPTLAAAFLSAAGVRAGARALDVGCGTGALTRPLVQLLGARNVVAVDPSPTAVGACRAALPGVDVHIAAAEHLPFDRGVFDVVLAQLVVTLMRDADQGVREMRRVTRAGGVIAACVWDFAGGMTVLRTFWDAAVALDPAASAHDQARTRRHSTPDELRRLWIGAGLENVQTGESTARASYRDFDDLWVPLVAPDGPAGRYHATLPPVDREKLRGEVCRRLGRPRGAFALTARAWHVLGQR